MFYDDRKCAIIIMIVSLLLVCHLCVNYILFLIVISDKMGISKLY